MNLNSTSNKSNSQPSSGSDDQFKTPKELSEHSKEEAKSIKDGDSTTDDQKQKPIVLS